VEKKPNAEKTSHYIISFLDSKIGKIPVVSSKLEKKDKLGEIKVRLGIGRDNYLVKPGLYAVGNPDKESQVFVTANYKLSFDKLRMELDFTDGWILVLDTKGINVWCAAGKGTFGTKELVKRIILSKLENLVNHRQLILPQLGAVGVSAHEIKKSTGFKVIYGPVKASDIKEFLANNFQKNSKMKTIDFKLSDRIVLIPVEIAASLKIVLAILVILSLVNIFENKMISLKILNDIIPFLGSFLAGTVIFPILLPFIPFRSFALKGFLLGFLWSIFTIIFYKLTLFPALYFLLVLPSITSFLALNFTGATTFTSLTGTKLEVKYSLPVYIVSVLAGIVIKVLTVFKVV